MNSKNGSVEPTESKTPPASKPEHVTYLKIPNETIYKIGFTLIVCALIYLLAPFFMLLFISVLLAVTFEPVARYLTKFIGRTAAVLLIGAVAGSVLILLGVIVVPLVVEQVSTLYHQLPGFADEVAKQFPPLSKIIKHLPQKLSNADPTTVSPLIGHLATIGQLALGGLSSVALIYVFMLYLLFDGARVYEWLLAFFKPSVQSKIHQTCEGIAPVISAYVIGQIITSVLCSVFTFAALTWIGVSAAAMLAVLAGIFDILPIVGFFMFAIPSALFALTVSSTAALTVVASYTVYHLIETYLISPLVYGNRLRVSGIVVLFSLLVGALVGGIVGAIAILPVVASYPAVEKIWLSRYLGRAVIRKHDAISEEPKGETEGETEDPKPRS